jgi:alkanesulfonate monooxygenase SsuD/methylene tetrahydromethanopterin reductase-like flavin-dependent oxidoreductase (luciferase family)
VGGPEEVTQQLTQYKKNCGMNLLIVRPQLPGANESEGRTSFEHLVEDVMPALN